MKGIRGMTQSNRIFGEVFDGKTEKLDYIPVADIDGKYVEEKTKEHIFVNILSPLFAIGGITHPDDNCGEFYRLDASKKDVYSEQNRFLASCTAGAQVRLNTDADSVIIKIWLRSAITGMNHFTNRGVYGLDMLVGAGNNRRYVGAPMQTFAESSTYNEGVLNLPKGEKEVLINLPLYGGLTKMAIGFPAGAKIAKPADRTVKDPVCFYGSSITQGGCVSRPGNMYSHILCRALDADCMNLGFSGSAMGEQSVAEYIGTRKISAFVMDYDFNSPTAETLRQTHEPFFQTVRKAHPDVPVIFVTHPYYYEENENDRKRKDVIRATYENAIASGDQNVYFVDSETFFPLEMRDLYAVDILHPNDLGHFMMAKAIYPALANALKK